MQKCRQSLRQGATWVNDLALHAFNLLNIPSIPVYETSSTYACALVNDNGRRYIAYNPDRLGSLHAIDPDLAAVVIFQAIGHYDNWYVNRESGRSKANELYAFRVAGWLAEQVGCDFDSSRVIFIMPRFNNKNDEQYSDIRQAAFRSGWLESSSRLNDRTEVKVVRARRRNHKMIAGLGAAGLLLLAAFLGDK